MRAPAFRHVSHFKMAVWKACWPPSTSACWTPSFGWVYPWFQWCWWMVEIPSVVWLTVMDVPMNWFNGWRWCHGLGSNIFTPHWGMNTHKSHLFWVHQRTSLLNPFHPSRYVLQGLEYGFVWKNVPPNLLVDYDIPCENGHTWVVNPHVQACPTIFLLSHKSITLPSWCSHHNHMQAMVSTPI